VKPATPRGLNEGSVNKSTSESAARESSPGFVLLSNARTSVPNTRKGTSITVNGVTFDFNTPGFASALDMAYPYLEKVAEILMGLGVTKIVIDTASDLMDQVKKEIANSRSKSNGSISQVDGSMVLDPDYDVTREDILGAYAPQTGSLPKVFADAFAGVDDQDKPKYFAAYIDTRYDEVRPITPLTIEGAVAYVPTIWPHEDKQGVFAINDMAAKELVDSLGGSIRWDPGSKEEGYYPHYHPKIRDNAHIWYPGK